MNFNNNNKKMNNEVELNNNKGEIKMNKKELKKINKKETCGAFSVNREFGKEFRELTGECATLTKVEKIRKIIEQEINNEIITTKDKLLKRRYELVHELYILGKEVQPIVEEAQPIEEEVQPSKTKYGIEVPYISSGIMTGYGSGALGGAGFIGSKIGESETKWRYHKCYVKENGLSVEETGDFIRFDKIKSINTGEKEGILIKHINICLELNNKTTFSFRIHPRDLSLLKIIEDNIMPEDDIIPENNTAAENNDSALDELLKAKELLEAGLLTGEEFNELKIKLLNNI